MKELRECIAYVLRGVLLCLNIYQCSTSESGCELKGNSVYTDTLTVIDTMCIEYPVPRDSLVIRYVTKVLPVAQDTATKGTEKSETLQLPVADNKRDSTAVEIPITQKVYETDQYRATVSGYQPSLDEILIFQPTQIVSVKSKPKRWGVGVQLGYGISIKGEPKFSPYIGLGVSYNLLQF